MRLIIHSIIVTLSMILSSYSCADIAIIVHPENKNVLDKDVVRSIFLGRQSTFPNGQTAIAIDLPVDDKVRDVFLKKVLHKNESSLNAYWARMIFSARGKPPRIVNNLQEMLILVSENKSAIGYIEVSAVNDKVRVLFTLP